MRKFSFKPKQHGNPNPDFRPPASTKKKRAVYGETPYNDLFDIVDSLDEELEHSNERISRLLKERYWKDKRIRQLESENEKLKDIIRNRTNSCEFCKGYDEKSPNYGYTEFCEDCFWYPWADETKCPNKWELKG